MPHGFELVDCVLIHWFGKRLGVTDTKDCTALNAMAFTKSAEAPPAQP
jgi:hypothetical protein